MEVFNGNAFKCIVLALLVADSTCPCNHDPILSQGYENLAFKLSLVLEGSKNSVSHACKDTND